MARTREEEEDEEEEEEEEEEAEEEGGGGVHEPRKHLLPNRSTHLGMPSLGKKMSICSTTPNSDVPARVIA
jgi:hypothetical protein